MVFGTEDATFGGRHLGRPLVDLQGKSRERVRKNCRMNSSKAARFTFPRRLGFVSVALFRLTVPSERSRFPHLQGVSILYESAP